MSAFLTYIFWPNPGNADYTSPKALVLLLICIGCIIASFVLPRLRSRSKNQQWKKMSTSWPTAAAWFGWTGLVLVIARVEEVQYLAMRFLWVLWGLLLLSYLILQYRIYRNRYYEVLPNAPMVDSRAAYIPQRKKR